MSDPVEVYKQCEAWPSKHAGGTFNVTIVERDEGGNATSTVGTAVNEAWGIGVPNTPLYHRYGYHFTGKATRFEAQGAALVPVEYTFWLVESAGPGTNIELHPVFAGEGPYAAGLYAAVKVHGVSQDATHRFRITQAHIHRPGASGGAPAPGVPRIAVVAPMVGGSARFSAPAQPQFTIVLGFK